MFKCTLPLYCSVSLCDFWIQAMQGPAFFSLTQRQSHRLFCFVSSSPPIRNLLITSWRTWREGEGLVDIFAKTEHNQKQHKNECFNKSDFNLEDMTGAPCVCEEYDTYVQHHVDKFHFRKYETCSYTNHAKQLAWLDNIMGFHVHTINTQNTSNFWIRHAFNFPTNCRVWYVQRIQLCAVCISLFCVWWLSVCLCVNVRGWCITA